VATVEKGAAVRLLVRFVLRSLGTPRLHTKDFLPLPSNILATNTRVLLQLTLIVKYLT
jgi:hypothetical protein